MSRQLTLNPLPRKHGDKRERAWILTNQDNTLMFTIWGREAHDKLAAVLATCHWYADHLPDGQRKKLAAELKQHGIAVSPYQL